jgi:hypothetical protein
MRRRHEERDTAHRRRHVKGKRAHERKQRGFSASLRESLDADARRPELADRAANHHPSVRNGAAGNPALL